MNLPISPSASRRKSRGFTLAESLVVIGISSLAFLALVSLTLFTGRTFAALFNYVDLDDGNRVAMDLMSRDIRTANRLASFATNEFTLKDANDADLTYRYSAGARTVTRVTTAGARVILRDCESFRFNVCQRTPKGATSEIYPAATLDTAKVMNLSWVCSRKILGYTANTESVQTARIVIRKQGPTI